MRTAKEHHILARAISDIQIGEHVFVEDLIEDFIGMSWNQGDNYRLDSCAEIWDGNDLKIQFKKSKDRQVMVG